MNRFCSLAAAALVATAGTTSAQNLTTDVPTIDVVSGGTQVMTVDAGPAFAGQFYFLVGTSAGDTPGFPFGGFLIPLNFSSYLNQTLAQSIGQLTGQFAPLNAAGQGTAQFTLGGGVFPPSFAGLTLHHAYVIISGVGPITLGGVSNSATLTFTAGSAAADIVITEFMKDPNTVGDNAGEYLEIYNAGTSAVDIEGWTIGDNDNDATVLDNGGAGIMVAPGQYFVLGANGDAATNGNVAVDFEYIQNDGAGNQLFLSNGADEIRLLDASGLLVDEILYDDGVLWAEASGEALELNFAAQDATSNDDPANWALSTCTIAGGPLCNPDLGTPGTASNNCTTMPCPVDNGNGQLLITEIMQNPAAVFDDAGEYVEVYNPGAVAVDMNGYTFSAGGSEMLMTSVMVPAGGYVVFQRNGDMLMNGGLPAGYAYDSGIFLSNGSQSVVIQDGASNLVCRVDYDNGATFPDPNGASMSLNPSAFDVDMANDGANWCESTSTYGAGDLGTPGAANDVCP